MPPSSEATTLTSLDKQSTGSWLLDDTVQCRETQPIRTTARSADGSPGSAPVGEIEIWKKGPDETYFRYASWSFGEWPGIGSFMVQPAMPGLPLSEGEYVLRYSSGVPSVRASVGNLVLLSGFWSPRD